MFRNYLKTAIRNLSANKLYLGITVAGLGVGIAVCLVIFIYIGYQYSFDNFHANGPRIYRLLTVGPGPKGEERATSGVPFPLATAVQNDLPAWKTTGIYARYDMQVMAMSKAGQPEKKFREQSGVYNVDPAFFSIFSFSWLAGDSASALAQGPHAVLSKSTAERYFGNWRQAVGRVIKFNDQVLLTVTGVIADAPPNSDLQVKILAPYSNGKFGDRKDWWTIDGSNGCYVLLPPNVTAASANRQLSLLSKKYQTADNKNRQIVEPLSAVHFDVTAGNLSWKSIAPERVRSLWLIAAFILLIACVNFINISTAQAVNRAREVGVRKVLGSNRRQLRWQFMMEALLLVVGGVLLAVLLVGGLMAPISDLLGMPPARELLMRPVVLLFLGATTLAVTLLAGFYPALVLSSFRPIVALKSKLTARSSTGLSLRRGLVVLQFVIAQGLIIGTLLMVRQMSYLNDAPMGFDKTAVLTVTFPPDSISLTRLGYLRDRLMAMKGVQQVSFNSATPAETGSWWTPVSFDHSKKGTDFSAISKWVDAGYLSTYSVPLVAGRNVTSADSVREFLINETMVHKLGFSDPRAVLGKEINLWGGFAVGPIVGVVRDFHASSFKDSLQPVFMVNDKRQFNATGIKMAGSNVAAVVQAIGKLWNDTYPNYVFESQWLDEKVASFYKEEADLSRVYKIFSSIAIFLSCLGLYGLAAFMASQRIKEVGIRKVLGATVVNIVYLFSREFVGLIGIAFVIAVPVSWYFGHQWLQQYVYRLPISGWIFVFGGLCALLIALATVSVQAFRAATVNPVKNLRTE
jgi:predicted permease